MKRRLTILLCSLFLTVALSGCVSRSGPSSSKSHDGTYYWSDFQVSHTVTISGNRWSGKSVVYGDVDYDGGVVKGNYLYDSSGNYQVARIYGGHIDRNNHSLRKK